jgi:hypothetical protein
MDARDGRVDRHLVSMVAASDTLIQYRKALDAHTARGGAVNPNEIRKSEDIWKVLSALVAGHITRDEAIAHYRILQLVHALPAPSPANARRMRRRLTRRVLNTYLRPHRPPRLLPRSRERQRGRPREHRRRAHALVARRRAMTTPNLTLLHV